MDVVSYAGILDSISHAMVIEASLPNFAVYAEFFSCSKGEATFDELDGPFQCHNRSEERMKVIWHHDKFVQAVFAMALIVE